MIKNGIGILLILGVALLQNGCKKEEDNKSKGYPLVYISTADHNFGEIYYANGDGSGARRISDLSGGGILDAEYYPTLCPDGNYVLFRGSDLKLKSYNFANESLTTLEGVWSFSWIGESPQVAYIPNNTDRQIVLCNPDGSGSRQITQHNNGLIHLGDTIIHFGGIQWHSGLQRLLVGGNIQSNTINGRYLIFIDPENGAIDNLYPLNFNDDFRLHGNKIAWINYDTVFIHDIQTKATNFFTHEEGEIRHPSFSPDGSRIAFIQRGGWTDIITCSLNGYDKRNVTEQIYYKEKYGSLFYPFWVSNSSLLYSAQTIYLIDDQITPTRTELAKGLKAGGQIQMIK